MKLTKQEAVTILLDAIDEMLMEIGDSLDDDDPIFYAMTKLGRDRMRDEDWDVW